jgi:hypothetical protein
MYDRDPEVLNWDEPNGRPNGPWKYRTSYRQKSPARFKGLVVALVVVADAIAALAASGHLKIDIGPSGTRGGGVEHPLRPFQGVDTPEKYRALQAQQLLEERERQKEACK